MAEHSAPPADLTDDVDRFEHSETAPARRPCTPVDLGTKLAVGVLRASGRGRRTPWGPCA